MTAATLTPSCSSTSIRAGVVGVTSKAGYWLGAALMIIALVAGTVWAVTSVMGEIRAERAYQRVDLPGTGTIELQAGSYVVYVEGPGANVNPPRVNVVITDPADQTPLALRSYPGGFSYSGTYTGSALALLSAPRAGRYDVRTSSDEAIAGSMVAFGQGEGPRLGRIFMVVVVLLAAFSTGAVLTLATLIRRVRMRPPQPPPPFAWS